MIEACKRAVSEFQREKQAALTQHLADCEKELLREAEERFRAVDDNRRRQREQDVLKARERNRNLETREKKTQRNNEELKRLVDRDFKELDRSLGDLAKDLQRARR